MREHVIEACSWGMKLILRENENFSHTVRDSVAASCAKPCPYKKSLLVLAPLWNVLWSWNEPCHDAIIDCSQSLYLLARKKKRAKRMGNTRGSGVGSYLVKSFVLRWVQFCRDSIRAFNERIKTRENRGLWTVYALKDPRHGFAHLKFSLNFSISSFVIITNGISVLIFSILNHPCSFMVFYYLFGVFVTQ